LSHQQLVDAVIRVIVTRISRTLRPADLSAETRLIDGELVLDSMALLDLVSGLEAELDIMIDESELEPSVFTDIGSLARHLGGKNKPT
jgi:acyl carrier protein